MSGYLFKNIYISSIVLLFSMFLSDLVIGVYVGFDNPRSLGKYETGSKAALPIFKNFVKSD